jgi:hypothetical protein
MSQAQVIVHRDLDVLLGAETAFCGLDRGMPKQELDLLEIAAILPAGFSAGTSQVVGANRARVVSLINN